MRCAIDSLSRGSGFSGVRAAARHPVAFVEACAAIDEAACGERAASAARVIFRQYERASGGKNHPPWNAPVAGVLHYAGQHFHGWRGARAPTHGSGIRTAAGLCHPRRETLVKGSNASTSLCAGDVVAGRYRVERIIGAGGMGTVVAARDLQTGAPVAIKYTLPQHAGNHEIRTRFHREARVTSWLKSEHVARVLDSGELTPPGGAPASYLVMERLEGRDLRSLVKACGMLPLEEAVVYVRQVCVALAEAHALGIVHRDLKPANLFRTFRADQSPVIKVLDFGIAKFQSANVAGDDIEMTGPAMMIGSRSYMAPEQMLDAKEVDARADIWALGVLLFFLLTESSPFEGESTSDMTIAILHDAPRRLTELRPDVPPAVEEIVRRCLEKVRDRRFANVVELSRALAPFAGPLGCSDAFGAIGSRTLQLPPLPSSDSVEVLFDATQITPEATPSPARGSRRRRWWLGAAGVAAALTVAAASAVAMVAHGVPPAAASAAHVAK
jgi:eukaryotic-like serine/threonine-protein kinase